MPEPASHSQRTVWAVALLSAAILGFEVSLMRLLLVASWHHFAFLVISVALLGFGASGSVLSLLRPRLLRRSDSWLHVGCLATALTIPLCTALAQLVPVEARFAPALVTQQVTVWIAYWFLLFIPFLVGATTLGLALMASHERLPTIYAANLAGSGAGALLAPFIMSILPVEWLPQAWGLVALAAAACLIRPARPPRALVAVLLTLTLWPAIFSPTIRTDPYKYRSHVERLVEQGSAERIAAVYGPRGLLEVYRSDAFHDMPFLAVGSPPPPMHALLLDGHLAGSILRIGGVSEAAVVDQTLMAFPYLVAPRRPRVLLLGETSGVNTWLALRRDAAVVDVVQSNSGLFDLLHGQLATEGGGVFDLPAVRTNSETPRRFVERSENRYDVIQIVSLQGSAAGSSGIGGLGQDHLVTVEGLAACFRRLNPGGVLFACRGIQSPPRDNIKLLATVIQALRRCGVSEAREHVVIVRDYLAVCTLVKESPWSDEEVTRLRGVVEERQLTPVWFRGIRAEELNQPDQLPPAPDGIGDMYYHAAVKLFSPQADRFLFEWPFEIRAPTDDRPFFLDYCKLKSLAPLKEAFGDDWVTRAELAFVFLLGTLALVALAAVLLTLLPALALPGVRRARGKLATAAYFTCLGLAYLLLEILFLSRLTLLIGDPVFAASLTLSAFLIFSGAGSACVRRLEKGRTPPMRAIFIALLVIGFGELFLFDWLMTATVSLADGTRLVVAVGAIAPLAFLMGFPMPAALSRLDRKAPALVPWAWGTNGFASVVAAPLATVLAMSLGFRVVGLTALALYLAAGWLFARLPAMDRI